jgi:ABC-2 type transport system ATP-binding protein
MPIIQLANVCKSFGSFPVIADLSLQVNAGELVTLLGVNGAGKTTTINLMLGLEKPDQGEILLLGEKPQSLAVRQQIGVTPQNTGFPEGLKVAEIIAFVQAHYASPLDIATIAQQFSLQDILDRQTSTLSGGQKRRLAVALAFVGNPRCVFLDEPTTGLDVESRQKIWRAIHHYIAAGGTVFLTTHYLEEAEALSTRIIILEKGCIKIEGTVAQIKAMAGLARVRFMTDQVPIKLTHVEKIENAGKWVTLHTHNVDGLIRELVQSGIEFRQLQIVESSLESAFLNMTQETREVA